MFCPSLYWRDMRLIIWMHTPTCVSHKSHIPYNVALKASSPDKNIQQTTSSTDSSVLQQWFKFSISSCNCKDNGEEKGPEIWAAAATAWSTSWYGSYPDAIKTVESKWSLWTASLLLSTMRRTWSGLSCPSLPKYADRFSGYNFHIIL